MVYDGKVLSSYCEKEEGINNSTMAIVFARLKDESVDETIVSIAL